MTVAYLIRTLLTTASITASVNYMDFTVTDAIAVMDTGGMASDYTHGTSPAIDDNPSFQILIHNASKVTADGIIDSILATLDGKMNVVSGTVTFIEIRQSSPAIYLGKVQTDKGETNEYSLNFNAKLRRN